MIGESYAVAGDGAETAALLLDAWAVEPTATEYSLSQWVAERIVPLRTAAPEVQQARVLEWIRPLDRWQRFTLFKLITGELRLGVSPTLAVRAIAPAAGLPPTTIAARLMGDWAPDAAWYEQLVAQEPTAADASRPYPFCLASPID